VVREYGGLLPGGKKTLPEPLVEARLFAEFGAVRAREGGWGEQRPAPAERWVKLGPLGKVKVEGSRF